MQSSKEQQHLVRKPQARTLDIELYSNDVLDFKAFSNPPFIPLQTPPPLAREHLKSMNSTHTIYCDGNNWLQLEIIETSSDASN